MGLLRSFQFEKHNLVSRVCHSYHVICVFICVIVWIGLVLAVGTGVCIVGEGHVCSTHDGG